MVLKPGCLPKMDPRLSKEEGPKVEQSLLFNVTQISKTKPKKRF